MKPVLETGYHSYRLYTHLIAYDVPLFLVVVLLQKLRFVRWQIHWSLKQKKSKFHFNVYDKERESWLSIFLSFFFNMQLHGIKSSHDTNIIHSK